MRKRIRVEMHDKAQLARKITHLCLDLNQGWEPVTPIMLRDSQMRYSTVTYFCILETKDYKPSKGWNRIWDM